MLYRPLVRFLAAALGVLALVASAGCASAWAWTSPIADLPQQKRDYAECTAKASAGPGNTTSGAAAGSDRSEASSRVLSQCMVDRGYSLVRENRISPDQPRIVTP